MTEQARGWAILTAVALMCIAAFAISGVGDDTPQEAHSAVGAWVACQDFVRDRLKAPATADFPAIYTDYTTHLGDGRYRVRSFVDAENSFGATLRITFMCEAQYVEGNGYRLVDLQMD